MTTEKERQDRAYEIALGNLLHARQEVAREAGEEHIDISDIDDERFRFFFNQGWSWGKEDRTYL